MAKMNNDDLRALVESQHFAALGAIDATKLSSDRARAMEYYQGDVTRDIPSEDGKSTAVSMDVADTVEGLMPQLMEIFAGADEVVQFAPVGPEDMQGAQQETDYVNHVFMNRNPGFMVLYAMIKDALLQKVGIVKVWWEERERIQRETYTDKTDDEYALIAAAQDVEIVEHTEKDSPDYPGMKLHDVVVETKQDYSCARVMAVPPEEFGVSRDCRGNLQDASYCYHKVVTRTVSDLIHDGYDEDQIRSLPAYRLYSNQEELARDSVNEHQYSSPDDNDGDRVVEITEHYIRVDMDGNGKAELYRIVTGGGSLPGSVGEILNLDGKPDVQPWDIMPFAAITPVPITHRFIGRSVADLVMDIQKIKTAMLRGALDNIYLTMRPRPVVAESLSGQNTIDDLLVHRAGAIVRTKAPGAVEWQVVPNIAQSIYPALEYFDSVREWRTGVTKAGQGIDANALQNQTATSVNQVYDAAQAKVKLIARIFAETGIRDMFMLLHATIKKHGDKPQTVRLRNQWVPVDPRNWKTRDDLTVNIGLGTGSKSQRLMQTMQIIGLQKEALANGLTNLVSIENLYNAAKEVTRLLGHKDVDTFFTDPATQPPPQPKQDPKLQVEQLKAQTAMQIQQSEQQSNMVRAQAEMQKAQAEAQIKIIEAQAAMREAEMSQQLAGAQIQVDQLKAAAQNQTVMAKAALDNLVKLEIARIMASKDTDSKPDAVEGKLSQDAGV
jgi:hypothetical protein